MKILIATGIYPPEIGGPASFVRSFAREAVRSGNEIFVITYGDEKTERGDGWTVSVVPRSGGALIRYVRYALRVWRLAKTVDLVFLQGPVSEGFPGTIGAILSGKKTVMKVVGDYAWEMHQQSTETPEPLDEFVRRRHGGGIGLLEKIERWTARHAQRIIVPSEYLKGIVTAWGVPADRVTVITNAVPPLPSVAPRDELRQKFHVTDSRVILTAVRAVPWKGVDFLLEILPSLPATDLLVVVGDGPVLEAWKTQAEKAGLTSRVQFIGRVDRQALAEWYAAADAFVLATGYEGFPHVVVEAALSGLPCFVSDRGGNPETQRLFPGQVTVLPYRQTLAWIDALTQPFARVSAAPSSALDFGAFLEQYLSILKTYVQSV